MRIALGLNYAGSNYLGWQSQPEGRTVQDVLEAALARFAGERVRTLCAGRTDTGVHALGQVVHFDSSVQREEFSWVRGVNAFLPPDVAVQWARVAPDGFHARSCALSRRYSYLLLQSRVRGALEARRAGWSFRPLDGAAMREAAQLLLGEHDFSSFRAAGCQAPSPVKTLLRLDISQCGAYWRFDFEGNAFLHHMIRNIMGCLVAVGQGLKPPQWMGEVLAARRRSAAWSTFSADGLYFLGPRYAPEWGMPERTPAFDWLPAPGVF
ncbi:MAG: tRNA pseudouridine(38-40) synthase TruA [Ottowia sp.]|nr:tRNA pseudouridine(38-40) synthase TruA [Ottowia sp.]